MFTFLDFLGIRRPVRVQRASCQIIILYRRPCYCESTVEDLPPTYRILLKNYLSDVGGKQNR